MTNCCDTGSYNPNTSILAGMSRDQLTQMLADAQKALIEMQLGKRGVKFSYTQGDGAKSVEFVPGSIAGIVALIGQLQMQLGLVRRARRPMRFAYVGR